MSSYPSRLWKYDQAMILSQYLINNGIDNLWIGDGNSDDPSISNFSLTMPLWGSIKNATLASPRIIMQQDTNRSGMSAENIVFQTKFEAGTLEVLKPMFRKFDMKGWKLGFPATISSGVVDTQSDQVKPIVSKLPALQPDSGAAYSIQQLNLTLGPPGSVRILAFLPAYSDLGPSVEGADYQSDIIVTLGLLMWQKFQELSAKNLLVGGYHTSINTATSAQDHPPTFMPTYHRLQQYPWIGGAPLAQESYGIQGDCRLNGLCFLEMTDNNPMPMPDSPEMGTKIPVQGNWFTNAPPQLAHSRPLVRDGWSVLADSEQAGNEAKHVIDGNLTTFWHTPYDSKTTSLPHFLQIDMQRPTLVSGLCYLPRQYDTLNGTIAKYRIELSLDGGIWTTAASGTWSNDKTLKKTFISPSLARYVRLNALSESQSVTNPWTTCCELNILTNAIPSNRLRAWASSEEPGCEASHAVDGNTTSIWHTIYTRQLNTYPHDISIYHQDADHPPVSGLCYVPRSDGPNGIIGAYRIEAAFYTNNEGDFDWREVASGSWEDDHLPKFVAFEPATGPGIKLIALSAANNKDPWASAGEIFLLDGTNTVSSNSSTDFGKFVVSRQNFFERYLIPKLRIINAALESHCKPPKVSIHLSGVHYNLSWQVPELGIGNQGSHPEKDPRYDSQGSRGTPPSWYWSSQYPDPPHAEASSWPSTIKTNVQCSTTSKLSFEAGSSRITIAGTTNVHMDVDVSLTTFKKENFDYRLNWTIHLDLVSVSDGGLAINLTKDTPTPQFPNLPDNPLLIKGYDSYLRQCTTWALQRYGDLANQLQQDLAGQQKFVFPAAGSYFFKDPVFNQYGDLECKVAFNGNVDETVPNPAADPRKQFQAEGPSGSAPSQPGVSSTTA